MNADCPQRRHRQRAHLDEVRDFAGPSDIRTSELYFVRKEEDDEEAAREIAR
jgi:hypothetical protein